VHLKRDAADAVNGAEFPDSVTRRGAKHLRELANVAEAGARAVMLYVVQRKDCDYFRLAADIDLAYAEAFADAKRRGVEAICYACDVSPERIEITNPLPIRP
jgi:sugar fermentation stimulation protein A